MDPLIDALKAAKATPVDPTTFRTLDEHAALSRPVAGQDFQVWKLPNRNARDGKQRHDWRLGVR